MLQHNYGYIKFVDVKHSFKLLDLAKSRDA